MTAPRSPRPSSSARPKSRPRHLRPGTLLALGLLVVAAVTVPTAAHAATRGKAGHHVSAIKRITSAWGTLTRHHGRTTNWHRQLPAPKQTPSPRPTTTPKPKPTVTPTPRPSTPRATTTPTPTPTRTTAPSTSTTPTATPTVSTSPTSAPATTVPTTPAPSTSAPATIPPTTSGTGSVSGLAMPTTDPPGWKRTFADDFNGNALTSNWGAYSGQPGGNPAGWWMPSHTGVSGGSLVLDGYADGGRNASGGVAAWGATQQTYGKYEVRFRADVGHGYGYVFLLWPASGKWPTDGEIDFAEDGASDRQSLAATLHYGANNSQVARSLAADFSQWHTIGVEWTAGKIVYTLDGAPWGSVTGSMVPSTPMFLAMQQAALPCTQWSSCVDSTTPAHTKIQVDWIVAYAPATTTPATSSAALIALPLAALGVVSPSLARTRRPSRRRARSSSASSR